ncbi:phage major tail tube protein [Paenibacillus sp. CGMCC 1.16610]|uniref:Phage tail protein n=1 Tax=Paenibacillus anseongense TaxID=2682845 RepID=A0ABW9U3B4_9BACL|nr:MULTISPECIES: phage major tail tube protein [Paenibacillus]MBA2943213.1 phage major tail tube protein [Paenibacillus sp. CGMCC 1.16610]MEC0269058.1 phage major tail tube protein [Paenibacillus anseongense]MVQ33710.1 phage tail protein [Paenibacillus anseongense]
MKQIPEKVTGYSVYHEGSTFLGVADVTLPSLESLSETIKGAGIAGEVDSPTIGHFSSMTCTLNWRTIDPTAIRLAAPKAHALDFRASQQTYDTQTGAYLPIGAKVSVRAIPKKFDFGKLESGATTDSSSEFEVIYLKATVDGKTVVEIDKYNYICIIDGVDYLAAIRQQLAL